MLVGQRGRPEVGVSECVNVTCMMTLLLHKTVTQACETELNNKCGAGHHIWGMHGAIDWNISNCETYRLSSCPDQSITLQGTEHVLCSEHCTVPVYSRSVCSNGTCKTACEKGLF